MITFNSFLEQAKIYNWMQSVSCFYSSGSFPPLFFARLFLFLKKSSDGRFSIQTIKSQDKSVRAATLQQSFLGQTQIYWLGDIMGQDALKFQDLQSLMTYQGPHSLIFFAPAEEIAPYISKDTVAIELPASLDLELFLRVSSFFEIIFNPLQKRFIEHLFVRIPSLSLDSSLLLLDYLELMPEIKGKALGQTILALLEPEGNFFDLSKHFFKKDAKSFFAVLKTISEEYAEPFWISYWSDQVWRAYHTIQFLQQKNIAQAKRVSYRLPFSFMTQQAKQFSLQELRNAHDFLYQADYALKTGQTFCSLDFFYMQFFNGVFAKE